MAEYHQILRILSRKVMTLPDMPATGKLLGSEQRVIRVAIVSIEASYGFYFLYLLLLDFSYRDSIRRWSFLKSTLRRGRLW